MQRGFLEISSDPPGCAIWVNGDLRQEVTPAKVEQLPFGREIQIKLTKEGLEAYRENVTLSADMPSKKVSTTMHAGSVTVVLKIDPPPVIWLDGKPWKGDKNKIENLSADEEHKIVLSSPGFVPKTITFSAKQGETKTFEERLTRGDGSSPAGTGTGGGGAATAAPTAPPPTSGGTGKVRINSKGGFCNVSVNGAGAGSTPTEAVVPAGNVRVTCKPPSGPSQTQVVKVGPGETARVSFKLD